MCILSPRLKIIVTFRTLHWASFFTQLYFYTISKFYKLFLTKCKLKSSIDIKHVIFTVNLVQKNQNVICVLN
ncbi:hypothetical protein BpHYR1_039500 [Brachionus plicatilis]|uniref:Uncharacterized protein n=1 Tax=Brachionus plicatilis TaxID=10195 RepID=A0A3M7P9R0_BRAPC|nr:hypothetical protein BpHYR1_039500 [Brachionus plicatilis]